MQSCLCSIVERRPLCARKGLRARQRAQDREVAVQITVDVINHSLEHLDHAAFQLRTLYGHGMNQQRTENHQQRGGDREAQKR